MERTTTDLKHIGTGFTVFEDEHPIEGKAVWLDSPQAVIDFCASGEQSESIVIARGGTTTFLTPALTGGVKGVVTLMGHPTSHLGILSREYGIPCVMGVQFTEGMLTDRKEKIPADGFTLRLDTTTPEGKVFIDPAAPTQEPGDPTPEEIAMQEQMAATLPLLENYQGEVPHGTPGNEVMLGRMKTDVMNLSDESVQRDLSLDEMNDLLAYMGWNIWDFLALRATEGESGLIPRQEYECFGCVWQWQRYPDFYRVILDAVGVDGLVDIGRTVRREPADKANLLHVWCTGFTPAFGRLILHELGIAGLGDRAEDIQLILQFMRRLYRGVWDEDGAPMFTSQRDYTAPLLDQKWIDRFQADAVELEGADRDRVLTFNAVTELLGFLLHFDNRSGLADTGPYDLGDGRFMIVRDHFLYDPIYSWHDVAEDLPHAITQALIFEPDAELKTNLMDGSTLFTEPANYLQHLTSAAVYVKDSWEDGADKIRRIDDAEIEEIAAKSQAATDRLYKRIASMSKREKCFAGASVYYAEFVVPFARKAGVWEKIRDEMDFFEVDPLASQTYYTLVGDGVGAQLVPKLFLGMGEGDSPLLPEGALVEVELEDLHGLALRGSVKDPDIDAGKLSETGLIVETDAGWMLTEEGTKRHASLLAAERSSLDTAALQPIYDRFLEANGPLKSLTARWQTASEDEQFSLLDELEKLVERVEPALRKTSEIIPRFDGYGARLKGAFQKAEEDGEYVTGHGIDSVHTVWMEIHEDFLQTLGISREEEGSF